jgi:hypothetical protein
MSLDILLGLTLMCTIHNIYMVFVGGTDILGWTKDGTETDTYITGLSLPLTDIKVCKYTYITFLTFYIQHSPRFVSTHI